MRVGEQQLLLSVVIWVAVSLKPLNISVVLKKTDNEKRPISAQLLKHHLVDLSAWSSNNTQTLLLCDKAAASKYFGLVSKQQVARLLAACSCTTKAERVFTCSALQAMLFLNMALVFQGAIACLHRRKLQY